MLKLPFHTLAITLDIINGHLNKLPPPEIGTLVLKSVDSESVKVLFKKDIYLYATMMCAQASPATPTASRTAW